MRTCLVLVILVAACKQEAKPAPVPPTTTAPVVTQDAAVAEPPKPAAEPAPPAIKPAGGINTAEEYQAKAFDLTDKLTEVFAGSGTNCGKLARNLEHYLEDNKDALAATDQFEAVNPTAEDDLEPKLQAKARLLIEKMSFSMQACGKHEGVKAALAKLPD